MTSKKRQHFVPIFYLNYFLDPNKENNEEPYLWVFEKSQKLPFRKSPKNIGFKKYFYSFGTEAGWSFEVEDRLSDLETQVSKIYDGVIKLQLQIHNKEIRYLFGKFICFMYNRTPKSREHTRILLQNIMKSKFVEMVNKEGGLKNYLKKHNKNWRTEEFLESFNKMKIRPEKHKYVELMLAATKSMIPHFCIRNWTCLVPKSDNIFFITSDHPVLPYDPNIEDETFVPGFIEKSTDIFFPISPRMCLLATYRFDETTLEIDDNNVVWINKMLSNWSFKYLFSCNRNYELLFGFN